MTDPHAPVVVRVTDPDSDVIATLLAERERRSAQMVVLQRSYAEVIAASDTSNADDEHDPEGATIAFERSQLAAQMAAAQASLDAVEAALERARTGRYGICSTCGRPIASARLEARPTATTCLTCARR